MQILIFLFMTTSAFAYKPVIFFDPRSLFQNNPLEVKLTASKILEKVPEIELNLVSLPKGPQDSARFASEMKVNLEKAQFDLAVVTIQNYVEILKLHSRFVPVGELVMGKGSDVCSLGMTFLSPAQSKKSATKPKVGALASGYFSEVFRPILETSSEGPVVSDRSKMVLLDLLKSEKINQVATVSYRGTDSQYQHPFKTDVEQKSLREVETKKTDIPCAVIIRRESDTKAKGFEAKFLASFGDLKTLERSFVPTTNARRKRINEIVKKN